MASPWPPSRDADLEVSAGFFAGQIAADPASFGIDPPAAAQLVAAAASFRAARAAVGGPATSTRVAVAAKREARRALLEIMRRVGGRVRAHPGTSPEQLAALGMVLPDRTKTKIPAPSARATLSVARIERLALEIRVADADSPTRRALPARCVGYAVFTAVHDRGQKPPADPRGWFFEGVGTRPRFRIAYRPEDAARQATIFVRFLNRKGQLGPPSDVATCTVAA